MVEQIVKSIERTRHEDNWRYFAKLILLIILTLFLVYESAAIGISPSNREVYFEPGTEKSLSFHIINNENKNMSASLDVSGEMAGHIKLNQTLVNLTDTQEKKRVQYTINMPYELEPGTWQARITAKEETQSDAEISASMSVVSEVDIVAVHDGKYLDAGFDAEGGGSMIFFTIDLKNQGNQDIEEAYADIGIYDQGNLIREYKTNKTSIASFSKSRIAAAYPSAGPEGAYEARARINYDGGKITANDSVSIGDMKIEIMNFSYNLLQSGTYKFDINLFSNWNRNISDAVLEIKTGDSSMRSAPFTVSPGKTEKVELFLESPSYFTDGLQFNISFGDDSIKYTYPFENFVQERKIGGWGIAARTIILFFAVLYAMYHTVYLYKRKNL